MLNDITYMWNIKYDTNELVSEIETDSDIENRGERGWGRDRVRVWA